MMFLAAVFFGPSFAMTQALATLRMRSVATSLLLFIQTLIGNGLGPSAAGTSATASRRLWQALAPLRPGDRRRRQHLGRRCTTLVGARTLRAGPARRPKSSRRSHHAERRGREVAEILV